MREPTRFRGKTLKEAREFIRSLELVFALAGGDYETDMERVLYRVMYLNGELWDTWHHAYKVDNLAEEGYT